MYRVRYDPEYKHGRMHGDSHVEGVMMDRKISRKLKGKVMDSCVVPANTYGWETLALSELQQHKLQLCANNWIRRIAGVKKWREG